MSFQHIKDGKTPGNMPRFASANAAFPRSKSGISTSFMPFLRLYNADFPAHFGIAT